MEAIRVGLISTDDSGALREAISKVSTASIVATMDGYCPDPSSHDAQAIGELKPEVAIVGVAADSELLISTLKTLKTVTPDTTIFVCLADNEPQLLISAMRAGASEFLEAPVSESDLTQAFSRYLSSRPKSESAPSRGELYSVIAGKLSSGATTVAINVANTIATATETPTLLADLDMPLGDAAAYLNLRPQYTAQDALSAASRLDQTLLENFTVKVKNSTLNLLGGFRDYTDRSAVTPQSLESLLRVSRRAFKHTVVDLSGSIDGDQAVVVARQSSEMLVVLTPDLPAIWRTEKLLTFLSRHGAADNVKLVLNRTSRRDDIGERDIERLLSQPVSYTLPNDYGACLKAINSGRPLQQEDSRSLFQAMQRLALSIAGIRDRQDSKGLLGMFLRPSSIGG